MPGMRQALPALRILPQENTLLIWPTSIHRVYCKNCKRSHALLPCFIIPYARVFSLVVEAAIRGICFDTHTQEELAELLGVEPTTISCWWRMFRQKARCGDGSAGGKTGPFPPNLRLGQGLLPDRSRDGCKALFAHRSMPVPRLRLWGLCLAQPSEPLPVGKPQRADTLSDVLGAGSLGVAS